jgi:hypothetical protein
MRRVWISGMTLWSLAVLLSVVCTLALADENEMRNIQAAVKNHICEGGTKYAPLHCDSECGGAGGCTPAKECLGDCLDTFNRCVKLMQQTNLDIDRYNQTCGRPKSGSDRSGQDAQIDRARRKAQDSPLAVGREQERIEREGREEMKRSERRLADEAKWMCYGGPGNVRAGFTQCTETCENYYSHSFCTQACKDIARSEGHGQSCFKRP